MQCNTPDCTAEGMRWIEGAQVSQSTEHVGPQAPHPLGPSFMLLGSVSPLEAMRVPSGPMVNPRGSGRPVASTMTPPAATVKPVLTQQQQQQPKARRRKGKGGRRPAVSGLSSCWHICWSLHSCAMLPAWYEGAGAVPIQASSHGSKSMFGLLLLVSPRTLQLLARQTGLQHAALRPACTTCCLLQVPHPQVRGAPDL